MEKYRFWSIGIIALFCLLLTSCTSYQQYPSDWAELIPPQDERCVDISGTYMNSGETAKGQSTYLTSLFDFEETPSTVAQVGITELDNDRLEISAVRDQKVVSGRVYLRRNKEYSCSSKGIEIPIGKIEKAVGAGESAMLYLTKSTDGTLVIERKSSAGGYSLLYIPMVSSSSEWYRFKPAVITKP